MKKNSKKVVLAASLLNVAAGSYTSASAIDALVKAVRAAGWGQDSVRNAFIAGQIMLKQQVNGFSQEGYDRALALVTSKAHSDKNPAAPGSRTKQQELWYVAAKVKWSRFLKDNGFESKGKNAGNKSAKGSVRQVKGSTPAPAPTLVKGGGKDVKVTPPTATEARAHIEMQLAALLLYANKHPKLVPTSYKQVLTTAKQAIDKAHNELEGAGPAL